MVLGKSDKLWAYISSENKFELKKILNKFKFETKYFASLENWMVSVVTNNKDIDWKLKTYRYILPDNIDIETQTKLVKYLDKTYSNYIYEHSNYQEFTSIDYIKDRINKGISLGLFVRGKLVAWGLTHDDGALGFLHVITEYRGNGYGKEIVKYLIKDKRQIEKKYLQMWKPKTLKLKNY